MIFRLLKNTGYLMISNQAGNLLQFLFFLYVAREFGQGSVGQYSFAFSFTYIMSVLADLGLSAYMMREVARDRSGTRRIFARCLSLRLSALALFTGLAVLVVVVFFENFRGETVAIVVLLGLYQLFVSVADIFVAELKGHDRMGLVSLLTFFAKGIIAGGGIILLLLHFNFLTVLTCFPLGALIYMGFCLFLSSRLFKNIKPRFRELRLAGLAKEIMPFALAFVFIEALYHLDILMLRFFGTDQAVGVYSAANRIILAVLGVNVFVHTALIPTFSRLFIDSPPQLIDLSKRTLRYLVVTGLPLAVGTFAISDKIIPVLYSNGFGDSIGPLKVLSWTIAVGFAAAPFSVLLTAINRQKEKVLAIGFVLVLNGTLNAVLIPGMSSMGAAWAKIAAEIMHLILMAFLAAKYLTLLPLPKILFKPALSCAVMYIFIRVFPSWSLIAVIPTAAAVFAVSLAIVRGYSREEIELVNGVLRKWFPKLCS
jgi:O-antigen/teichoic acid export membrane protein